MNRHLILIARISLAALVASFVLFFALPAARAQDQAQIDNLRKDVSYLNSRVCGVTGPTDPAAKKVYDDQKQALADAAAALIAALEQQKSKLTGSDFDTTLRKQRIDDEEKSLKQACPALPGDLENLIISAPSVASAAPAVPSPLPQLSVSPATVSFDKAQTIGTRSDPVTVTITNSSSQGVNIFVWYGTRLSNFWVSDDTCNALTPPQGNCTFKVAFAPTEMPAPDRRAIVENLRVVRREDWNAFDRVRTAYKEAIQAQAAVDKASANVRQQRKELKSTAGAVQFCEGAQGTQLDACTNLKNANNKLKEIQSVNKVTEGDFNKAASDLREKALAIIPLSGNAIHWKYPLTRGVVGLDLSAVSSQTVRQAYFVDFNILAPFKFPWSNANQDALESRWWFWLNPRITSLPKAADTSALSTIDEAGTFFSNFSNQGHTADIAQGFDVNAGVEMALLKPRDGIAWWGEYVNTQARLGVSLIAGAGVATPFSVPDTDVTSQVNQSICDAFKAPTGATISATTGQAAGLVCTIPSGSTSPQVVAPDPNGSGTVNDQFISFFTPQRSRFFRRYYGGFRLKTYFFSPDVKGECKPPRKDQCDAPYDIFPGIIDITAGQDEAVTRGKLSRVIFRIEGVYPLPFVPGLHVFGSIYTSFKGSTQDQPFNTFAINTPTTGAANDANTFRFPLNPLDRDYFRVGVGVDLIQLLKRNKGGQPTTTTASQPAQSDNSAAAAKP